MASARVWSFFGLALTTTGRLARWDTACGERRYRQTDRRCGGGTGRCDDPQAAGHDREGGNASRRQGGFVRGDRAERRADRNRSDRPLPALQSRRDDGRIKYEKIDEWYDQLHVDYRLVTEAAQLPDGGV